MEGYYGGEAVFNGQVYKIFLNGMPIGKLGTGKTVIGNLVPGLNTVQAKFTGIMDFEMGSDTFFLKATKRSYKFIIVKLKSGAF